MTPAIATTGSAGLLCVCGFFLVPFVGYSLQSLKYSATLPFSFLLLSPLLLLPLLVSIQFSQLHFLEMLKEEGGFFALHSSRLFPEVQKKVPLEFESQELHGYRESLFRISSMWFEGERPSSSLFGMNERGGGSSKKSKIEFQAPMPQGGGGGGER